MRAKQDTVIKEREKRIAQRRAEKEQRKKEELAAKRAQKELQKKQIRALSFLGDEEDEEEDEDEDDEEEKGCQKEDNDDNDNGDIQKGDQDDDSQKEDGEGSCKKEHVSSCDDNSCDSSDMGPGGSPTKKKKKMGKNPDVDTSFLPDREREEEENTLRETLRQVSH